MRGGGSRRPVLVLSRPTPLDRLTGILLFLPVPVVLALFVAAPLGPFASLGLGVILMGTHRLYARPWALARAGNRCLWCARGAASGPPVSIDEPGGRTEWRCCSARHEDRLRRFLGWADRRRTVLLAGILGSLALFLAAALLVAFGHLAPVSHEDAASGFRLAIALTVLPLGWLGPSSAPAAHLRAPFPVHIQALVGSVVVVWLFRLVGLWWLLAAVAWFWRRG